ncbi:hypothetical protein Ac2012v2_000237 [Leucoagaricus gongylophorus]
MTYRQRQIKLPAHWPNDVHYLRSCQFHASVTPSLRDFVKGDPSIAGQLSVSYPTCVTIRHITSSAHPANGQCGLFVTSHIEPNTRIIDYTGEIHSDDRSTSDYDLCLHRSPDGLSLGIDAHKSGNEARFINDYRGVSKRPSALFRDNRLDSGDEILVSYGKSWWQARSECSAL